jgi:hypothetical protein
MEGHAGLMKTNGEFGDLILIGFDEFVALWLEVTR